MRREHPRVHGQTSRVSRQSNRSCTHSRLEVEHGDPVVAVRRRDFRAVFIPANLEDPPVTLVRLHQLTLLHVPDQQPVVEGTGRQVLAVGGKRDGVHRLRVPSQRVHASTFLGVPELDRSVVRRRRQHQRQVRVVRSRPGRGPLDGVNLFRVLFKLVHALVLLQAPHARGVVV